MQLIHVTRNSPNWLELEKNYESHQINETIKQNMRNIFKQWNTQIKPSYFIFRNQIALIAKGNHKKIKADVYFDSALDIQNKVSTYDKYIVLFTDDDDWNHPRLFDFVLDAYLKNPQVDAIQWNHCAFCSNFKHFDDKHNRPYFIMTNNTSFHTNNYILTDNFFKKFGSTEDVKLLNYGKNYDIYYGHTNVDNFFKNRMNFIKLPNYLSVASKNISSYSYWWENDASYLSKIIDVCNEGGCDPIPPEVDWSTEEILTTLNLYKLLKRIKMI